MDSASLQNFVRTQFLSIPKRHWTMAYQEMVLGWVQPLLDMHTGCWNPKVIEGAREVASKIRSRTLSDMDSLNLRMACQVAAGSLNEHPLIQGILVAALELAHRNSHGVYTMKNLQVSPLELGLMAEAGCMVACAANNAQLLTQFGLAFTVPRLPLASLHNHGLPEPWLAVTSPTILQTNARLIEQILKVSWGQKAENHEF